MTVSVCPDEPREGPSRDWLAAAATVAEKIRWHARSTTDGSRVWLDPAKPQDESGKPVRLDPHLYSGSTGVVLFLAAFAYVSGNQEYRDLALRGLAPLRRQMAHLAASPAAAARLSFRLGGTTGLGAYLYSFLRIGRWLDEPALLGEACAIASLLTPERVAADESLDVMQGSAGAVLGLLALEREVPAPSAREARLLERAVSCGDHLLHRRISRNGLPRAWSVNGYTPWCGFGHGAAGIAYALTKLADRTGRDDFWEAALEGLAFERAHYHPEHKNWQDLRNPDLAFMHAWCHGAPGIALGRLGMLPHGGAPQIPGEIHDALETTRKTAEGEFDFVCCGNLGRAEILLQAALQLNDQGYRRAAQEIAARALDHSRDGLYRWSKPGDERFNPVFFTGAAGIGYTLLRLHGSTDLPCVLCLE
jgi:type 2 lantibiotic biosynthesis protein LanM